MRTTRWRRPASLPLANACTEPYKRVGNSPGKGDPAFPPCSKRTDNATKVRYSATLGQEPEIELELV